MSVKYSKAPISEIIFGIFFNSATLLKNGIIFELLLEFRNKFPVSFLGPAAHEQIVENNLLGQTMDFNKSGFSLYRLLSTDQKRQLLLQNNFISYSWVRPDNELTGDYPGFEKIFSEFNEIYNIVKKICNNNKVNCVKDIDYYHLGYVNRLNLTPYLNKGMNILDIINVSGIQFDYNKKRNISNNFLLNYSTICNDIGGYIITSLNTPTIGAEQMLILENKIDGSFQDKNIFKEWFNTSREIQNAIFESLFNKNLLKNWI